jgi:hypothetical protein
MNLGKSQAREEIPPAPQEMTDAVKCAPKDEVEASKDLDNKLQRLPGEIVDLLRKTGALKVMRRQP